MSPCPAESDAFSDGQTQRGMDRYLDSLFDPVLSDGSVVSSDLMSTPKPTTGAALNVYGRNVSSMLRSVK